MSSLFRFSFIIKEKKPGKPEKRPFDENLTINVTDKYLMSTDLDAKIVLKLKNISVGSIDAIRAK